MQELRNNIKPALFIPLTIHDGDSNASLAGSAVDTKNGESSSYDSALVIAMIGSIGADVDVATITIQEDDDSSFSSPSVADGGEANSIVGIGPIASFEILRSKRYLRALLTIEESGADDDVEIAVSGLLTNWARPFPIVL